MDIIISINKPSGITSHDAVSKVKRILKAKKAGHTGTLDPLATGLLIICTGRKTKEIYTFQDQPKEYIAEIFLGATTPSFDLETEIDQTFKTDHITEDQ